MNGFSIDAIILSPWRDEWQTSLLLVSMGWLVAVTCGWLGALLLLRKVAMMGDTLSHSLLPGLVLAYLFTGNRGTAAMWLGALAAAAVTILLIELIQRFSRIKADAAMGIVFSTMFAFGVVLITLFSRHIDLDADCVLYGELLFIIVHPPVEVAGLQLPPADWLRMAFMAVVVLVLIAVFYKEILATGFDPTWAGAAGLPAGGIHYGMLLVLSLVIVSAFDAVGAILVVAMIAFPGATALLHCQRLPGVLAATALHALIASLGGFHLSVLLEVSMAACMATVALIWLLLIWSLSKIRRSRLIDKFLLH